MDTDDYNSLMPTQQLTQPTERTQGKKRSRLEGDEAGVLNNNTINDTASHQDDTMVSYTPDGTPNYFPQYAHPSPHLVLPNMSPDVLQSVLERACSGLSRTLAIAPTSALPVPIAPDPSSIGIPCGPVPSGIGGSGAAGFPRPSPTSLNYYTASHLPCADPAAFIGHPSHVLFARNPRHLDTLRRLRSHVMAAAQLGNRSSHALWGCAQSGKRRIISCLGSLLRPVDGMLVLELDGNVTNGDDEAIRRIVEETRAFLQSPASRQLRRQRGGIQRLGTNPTLHDLLALGEDFECGALGEDLPIGVGGSVSMPRSSSSAATGGYECSQTPNRHITILGEDVLDGLGEDPEGDNGVEGGGGVNLFGEEDAEEEGGWGAATTKRRITTMDDEHGAGPSEKKGAQGGPGSGGGSTSTSTRFTAGPASSTISGALSKLQACLLYFNQVGVTLVVLIHNIRAFGMSCDRVMYILSGLLHEASLDGLEVGAPSAETSSRRRGKGAAPTVAMGPRHGGVSFIVSSLAPDVTLEKRLSSRLTCEMWFCPLISQPPLTLLPNLFLPIGVGDAPDCVGESGRSSMKPYTSASPAIMWGQTSTIVALHLELQALESETCRLFERALEKNLKADAATRRRQQIHFNNQHHVLLLNALADEQKAYAEMARGRGDVLATRRAEVESRGVPKPPAGRGKKGSAAPQYDARTEAYLRGDDLPPLPPPPPKTIPPPPLPTVQKIVIERKSFEELYDSQTFEGLSIDDTTLLLPLIIKMNRLRRELSVAELIGSALYYAQFRAARKHQTITSSRRSQLVIRVSGVDEVVSLPPEAYTGHASATEGGGTLGVLRSSLMGTLVYASQCLNTPPPNFAAMTVAPSLLDRMEAPQGNAFAFSPATAAATQALPIFWTSSRVDAVRSLIRPLVSQLQQYTTMTNFTGGSVASCRWAVVEVLSRGMRECLASMLDYTEPRMYLSPHFMEVVPRSHALVGSLTALHEGTMARRADSSRLGGGLRHMGRYEALAPSGKGDAAFALPPSGTAELTDLLDDGNLVRLGYACTEHIVLLSFVFVRGDAGLKRSLRDLQEDIHSTMRDSSTGGMGVGVGMGTVTASQAQRATKDHALATAFNDLKEWGLLGEDRHGDVVIIGPSVRLHDFLRWFLGDAAVASQLGMDAMSRQMLANMVR